MSRALAQTPPPADRGQGDARRLASGSLMQQVSQVAGLVAMFAIVTVLARQLTLSELGVYGLLNALAGYLLIVQNGAAAGAVRNIAGADGVENAGRAYSTALALYVAAGLAAGVVVAGLGAALTAGIDLSDDVRTQATTGALLLGAVTALGWPATIHRDALRADGLFVRAAKVELGAVAVYAALVLGLAAAGASLSLLIAASGTIPLFVGLGSLVAARASRLPYRFARGDVSREAARDLAGIAGYVSGTEAAVAAIFTLNRTILGLFKSAATVGLYEGPVRAHNLIRSLTAAAAITVLPTASAYSSAGDTRRLRELTLRGSRYVLALTVPLVVTGMVMAAPLLDVWLGDGFGEGGAALAILLSHWLLSAPSAVLGAVLVGVGRPRPLARWAAAVALADVALALVLVPVAGLEGVALATALPYFLLFGLLARPALDATGVAAGELARTAYAPALIVGAGLAAALGAVRLVTGDESVAVAAALTGPPLAWLAYYGAWLSPSERRLVRDVAASALRQGRA